MTRKKNDPLEAVKLALGRGVSMPSGVFTPEKVYIPSHAGVLGREIYVLLKSGSWAGWGPYGEHQHELNGVIGGFNRNALHVARSLVRLHLVTQDQADAFVQWFEEQEKIESRGQDERKMRELARDLGFEVRKRELEVMITRAERGHVAGREKK